MIDPIFLPDPNGDVIADGAVLIHVHSMREVMGYQPIAFGTFGAFDLADFPGELELLDEADDRRLFVAHGPADGVHVAVVRVGPMETVNLFMLRPTPLAMVAAHWLETEVIAELLFDHV